MKITVIDTKEREQFHAIRRGQLRKEEKEKQRWILKGERESQNPEEELRRFEGEGKACSQTRTIV